MSYNYEYPYVNHEPNSDFMLRKFKEIEEKEIEIDEKIEPMVREKVNELFADVMYNEDEERIIITSGESSPLYSGEFKEIQINNEIHEVKDSEARENISNIEEDIDDIKTEVGLLNSEVHYYCIGGSISEPSGTCFVIESKGIGYIVDFGYTNGYVHIKNLLLSKGITKINGIFISHYHNDHVGGTGAIGLSNLLEDVNLDYSECIAYLPHKNINYSSFVGTEGSAFQSAETLIKGYIANKGITWKEPSEGEVVLLDENLKVTFNNTNSAFYDEYYTYTLNSTGTDTGNTTYNNFSMVISFEHLNHVFCYTGDIQDPAQHNMAEVVRVADILTATHHGLNRLLDSDYLKNITPKIMIIPCGTNYWREYWLTKADVVKVLKGNKPVYNTAECGLIDIKDSVSDIDIITDGDCLNLKDLSFSLAWGEKLPLGTDYNDITFPCNYNVQNTAEQSTMENAPFTGGCRLVVMQDTATLTLTQIAMSTGSSRIKIAIRRGVTNTDESVTWDEWLYTMPSVFHNKNLTNDDFIEGVSLRTTSGHSNSIAINNGVLNVSLDITTSATIPVGSDIYSFDCTQLDRTVYFPMFDRSSGEVSLFYITYRSSDHKCFVRNSKALESGKSYSGFASLGLAFTI